MLSFSNRLLICCKNGLKIIDFVKHMNEQISCNARKNVWIIINYWEYHPLPVKSKSKRLINARHWNCIPTRSHRDPLPKFNNKLKNDFNNWVRHSRF
mmetsp:Transcript_6637/g.18462  ORF Transcript_6637/g.18462 Transcript_6637/m.18462 type:complete len:97 (-) Transcript_6637:80-370(-)